MSNGDLLLEAVFVLSPGTAERARRLAVAITLLRAGTSKREARALLRLRFGVSRVAAWRLVDVAADVAEMPEDPA
jgi:hypothetical protein